MAKVIRIQGKERAAGKENWTSVKDPPHIQSLNQSRHVRKLAEAREELYERIIKNSTWSGVLLLQDSFL